MDSFNISILFDTPPRLHVVLALQWLIEGDSVHQVAMKLAYDSDTSFILMFKKVMGTSPKKYILQFQ